MAVNRLKPSTPGARFTVLNKRTDITTKDPEKSLLVSIHDKVGRSSKGNKTVRFRGGGHKKQYRIIDFNRDKFSIQGKVETIEYDPYRSSFISLILYKDGEKRYIITPEGIKIGQEIVSGENVNPEVGNSLKLANIPLGTIIHNIELNPGQGAAIARSAGTYAQLLAREGKYAVLKMPSGETRLILNEGLATIGSVSNSDHALFIRGKAGRSRWMGKRPRTRNTAKNPVDHPMGGGEGKKSGGHPRSKKGLYAKGQKTRKRKSSDKVILERRKK